MKKKPFVDLQESLFNFTHTALDEDILPILDNMNGNFIKYKHQLRSYFAKIFHKDQLANTTWASKLPKDETNLMVERLCGYFENQDNLEKFHKMTFLQLKDYLSQ